MALSERVKTGKAAAALVVFFFLASCASREITVFKLVPTAGMLSTGSVHSGQVNIAARYLDASERTDYLTSRGYEALGLGLRRIDLVSFVLHVKNGSDLKLIVDPGSIRLSVGYGPLLSPYSYAHLYMKLPPGSDRQRTLEALREGIVLDRSTTILPGHAMERLLLFERPEKAGPEAAIIFKSLYVGGEETGIVLKFRTVDLGK